jgi:hypothetical protein
MIETRPIGRLRRHPSRNPLARHIGVCATLLVSLAMAGEAAAGIGGVGGVSPFQSFERQPQTCPRGNPTLTPERIRSILKRRGYYAIRDLRYLKPLPAEWVAPVPIAGRYVATASRGFGIVRWQLSVDACTAQVAVGRGAQTHTH